LCGCPSLSLVGTRKAARVRTTGGFTRTCQQSKPADLRDRPGSVTERRGGGNSLSHVADRFNGGDLCAPRVRTDARTVQSRSRRTSRTPNTHVGVWSVSPRFRSFPSGVRWLSRQAARTHARTDSVARCREMLRGFYLFSFQTHT
jgi:hypothetical protein